MGRIGRSSIRWAIFTAVCCVLWPFACTRQHPPRGREESPIVRVRLLAAQDAVTLRVNTPPTVRTASESTSLRLNMSSGAATLALTPGGWTIGGVAVPGQGELSLWQGEEASVFINDRAYRGRFRFVPVDATKFDVVNDVDVDGYLKGVLAREMLKGWTDEAYRAQAIVARTYALYECRSRGTTRHWDVYCDQRSQVYGGYGDETDRSREAADHTSGVVLAFGPSGREKIFKTYFSACCGGVSQSAADGFGEAYVVPLSDQNVHGLCSPAPRYNWGPVEITRTELTRRLREYGVKRDRSEKNIGAVVQLEIQQVNRYNRPIRFVATDDREVRYSLSGEELRNAINAGANADSPAKLYSSFVKVINEPGGQTIRFVEGHGNGHGVGLCQWCSEIRAEAGMRHEDIVLSAFPRARLVRAY
jgi:stage II sporulation protein D